MYEAVKAPAFLQVLRRRTQELGESTQAIRASVLTDGWNFTTSPPPEAKVIGAAKWLYERANVIDTKQWVYRCVPRTPEFVELQR